MVRIRIEYGEILHIQSECGKMQTKIIPKMGTFYAVVFGKKPKMFDRHLNKRLAIGQMFLSLN